MIVAAKELPATGRPNINAIVDVDACIEQVRRALDKIRKCDDPAALADGIEEMDLVARALKRVEGAEAACRLAGRAKLEAMARVGQLCPATPLDEAGARGGRPRAEGEGEKAVTDGDGFSPLPPERRMLLTRCRKVAAAQEHLDAYLDHCNEQGEEVTRAGLISFATAQEKVAARGAAIDVITGPARGPKAWGENKPADQEPGQKRNDYEADADDVLQAIAKITARRHANSLPILLKGRDEQIAALKRVAGNFADLGRAEREQQEDA